MKTSNNQILDDSNRSFSNNEDFMEFSENPDLNPN